MPRPKPPAAGLRPRPTRRTVSGRNGSSRRRGAGSRPPGQRLVALLSVFVLGFVGIVARLLLLQVKDAAAYQRAGYDLRVRTITLPASRGTIFDRAGEELAMSLPARAVYADPKLVHDAAAEAAVLAPALHLDAASVERQLAGGGHFVYLAHGVDPQVAKSVQARNLPGIGFLDETRRYYPGGSLAPQVVGFVDAAGVGADGLELEYQRLLAGRAGRQTLEEDPSGTLIPQGAYSDTPPVPGDDLVLTLDREIQFRAQQALAAGVKANRAKGGTVIVMNPHTGEILAMATYPWFDPNDLRHVNLDAVRNRSVTDVYEPGSVNKVITAAAALQEHVLTLNQTLRIPDSYTLYGRMFHDAEPHPTEQMTLGDIIAYSSNVGAITVASMLGQYRFASYLYRFGLSKTTGSGFPGESAGILPPSDRWSGTDMGSMPIGQGVAVTPLQMLLVYATIANRGVWVQPRFVRGAVDPAGRFIPSPPPETRRVVSAATARTVTRLLAYGVDVGTGTNAQIPGYWVAGKTGTARKILANGTGYSDKYMASFIGFAPAADPALAAIVVLDEPTTVFGGIAAAPVFRDVMRFALARLRVPPAPKLPIPPHAVAPG